MFVKMKDTHNVKGEVSVTTMLNFFIFKLFTYVMNI